MKNYDLVIIGGGSAGMAAAIEAYKNGVKDLLILEKDDCLGGILNQCIHNGFGLTEFKEELTGPEYLARFANQVKEFGIPYKLNTLVTNLTKDKIITYTNKTEGEVQIKARSIIIATGCYERSAGAIALPGDRPSGIITAGTAQKYLNIYGYMCGKKVVILGSGDIGLIMARRLTLEGAKVICVAELMPYSNGLNRNIAQCLNDYNIPLYLSTSVSKVVGKKRLEKVILSKVDKDLKFIPGTEQEIECDTLILSIGLIPYISLLNNIDCPLSKTKGALVDENLETQIDGIFTCGNSLHVHDVVDFVTDEGRLAGLSASQYLANNLPKDDLININTGNDISYSVPQYIHKKTNKDVIIKFRVKKPMNDQIVTLKEGDNIIYKTIKPVLIPSEMVMIKIPKEKINEINQKEVLLSLESR